MLKYIFWIASYLKSESALLRAILCSLFLSKDGTFSFELINPIQGLENKFSKTMLAFGYELSKE